ncbi:MAG TPA: DUF58 domain-containing protein [Acidimicrobiia bacterium]
MTDAERRRGDLDLSVPPSRPARGLQAGPGDFTAMAVLWGAFGLYALRVGFVDDRGPLVLVGATAFAVIVVGLVWPIVALRNVDASLRAPGDATVGNRVPIGLEVHGRARDVSVRLLDPPTPWIRADRGSSGTVVQRPSHRGVYRRMRIEIKTSAPLGVFTRRRVLSVALPAPVYVAPRTAKIAANDLPVAAIAHERVAARSPYTTVDAVRSVRPFVSGDPARHIHWPSSARRGELVVRDFDPPAVVGLAIQVDLRSHDLGAIERAASLARAKAEAVLAEGAACCLLTFDTEPRVTYVTAAREVGRLLAAAMPGDPPDPPPAWPVEVVRA